MRFKTIGILGGIGPSASASMYSRIIERMQNDYNAWDDADFPQIMVYSTFLRGFDELGIAEPELAKQDLLTAVQKLEHMGSDMVVVACNTVHYFDTAMQQALTIPLVHMISEACQDASLRGLKKVGVACSQTTRDMGLYSKELIKVGVEPIVATDNEQNVLNTAIKDVMAGRQSANTIHAINQVFNRYRADGAEAVILGCTELPLAIQQKHSQLVILDANDIVVKKAIELALS